MGSNYKRLVIHEDDGKKEPDICGEVIELLNEKSSGCKKMSIATVFINPGKESIAHYHKKMEEIYYIVDGEGEIIIDKFCLKVRKGHAILLPNGAVHKIKNIGKTILKLISIDSPVFDDVDVFQVD